MQNVMFHFCSPSIVASLHYSIHLTSGKWEGICHKGVLGQSGRDGWYQLRVLWLVLSFSLLCITPASLVPPVVIVISANQEVTSPDPVSFNCTVDSYPSSNITWLHNGAEVQAAPPRVTISTVQVDSRTQESTLTLLNTTAEDIGTYNCSAVNDVGSTNMTTELRVLGECGRTAYSVWFVHALPTWNRDTLYLCICTCVLCLATRLRCCALS